MYAVRHCISQEETYRWCGGYWVAAAGWVVMGWSMVALFSGFDGLQDTEDVLGKVLESVTVTAYNSRSKNTQKVKKNAFLKQTTQDKRQHFSRKVLFVKLRIWQNQTKIEIHLHTEVLLDLKKFQCMVPAVQFFPGAKHSSFHSVRPSRACEIWHWRSIA